MRTSKRERTIPITPPLQVLVNRQERAFREVLQIRDLPLLTKLTIAKDGRGGTHLVCHLHAVFPNGVSSNSEGRSPEPIIAIRAAFERMAEHAPFCLKWTQLRPSHTHPFQNISSQ